MLPQAYHVNDGPLRLWVYILMNSGTRVDGGKPGPKSSVGGTVTFLWRHCNAIDIDAVGQ